MSQKLESVLSSEDRVLGVRDPVSGAKVLFAKHSDRLLYIILAIAFIAAIIALGFGAEAYRRATEFRNNLTGIDKLGADAFTLGTGSLISNLSLNKASVAPSSGISQTTIVFARPIPSTPNIYLSVDQGANDFDGLSAFATGVTTTGFTLNVSQASTATNTWNSTIQVSWLAIA